MADIEIKICTFCGAVINDSDMAGNVWFCPKCNNPQSGEPQNESTSEIEG